MLFQLFVCVFVCLRGRVANALGWLHSNYTLKKIPLGAGGEKGRQVLRPSEGLQSILQQVLPSAVIAYVDAL